MGHIDALLCDLRDNARMLSLPSRYFWLGIFMTMLCSEMALISILLHDFARLLELARLRSWLVSERLHVVNLHIRKGVMLLGF